MKKECRNVETELKNVLDDLGQDEVKKAQLLKGRRVEIIEELSMFVINYLIIKKIIIMPFFLLLNFRTSQTNSRKVRRLYCSLK